MKRFGGVTLIGTILGLMLGACVGVVIAYPGQGATNDGRAAGNSVNERGETYGSALNSEKDPDLIQAIGVDGSKGYVRSSDLNSGAASSLEEARQLMEYAKTHNEGRLVPLYASDGSTIVGEFEVQSAQVSESRAD